MKETMIRMDPSAHAILKKHKENLRKKGVRVSLGGALREMDKIISTVQDDKSFARKDLKALAGAVEILRKYKNPTFSNAIGEMDVLIEEMKPK
jgi:hypothetical protein